MPLPVLIGVGAAVIRGGMTAATLAPLVKPAIGIAKRFLQKSVARPGIGSKVTKGPLKLGGKVIFGPKPGMSTAAKVASVVGAGGVGAVTVASHRQSGSQMRPATSPAPRRAAPVSKSTATREKLCCPAGTKRKVCFKRDVDPEAEAKRKARKRTAKARALKRGRKSARKRARRK